MHLTTDDWLRVKELFSGAVALPSTERGPFLSAACHDTPDIRREVESLLVSYDTAGTFLEQPIASVQALLASGFGVMAETSLDAGERLGPYEILEQIGAGGMGEVYRARDVRLDRVVALKTLRRPIAPDPVARQRFEREARTISSLNHPHICNLYDVGRHDGVDYLVMEFLDGETLAARLTRGPLPVEELLTHAVAIAGALESAHARGIVHRDLKPSNIVLTAFGAKLVDFGIAKPNAGEPATPSARRSGDADATQDRGVMGTVGYMAPELLAGKPADARSDLFSFGALIYEMAAGRRPFIGSSTDEVSRAVIGGTPASLDAAGVAVPQGLARIVDKALQKDPDHRYRTAAELRADLERLRGELQAAPPVGTRRLRAFIWLAGIAAVIGTAFVLIREWPVRGGAASRPSVAVLPFQPIGGAPVGRDDGNIGLSIADALIGDLSEVRSVSVRPLGTTAKYTDASRDPIAIGRALHVDLVVDGAIERSGDVLQVHASVLRVADAQRVWTEQFKTPWTDVFRVQDAIAGHVVGALSRTLTDDARQRVARRRTSNVDAYDAYLKGRYFWNLRTPDGFRKALAYFQHAIDKDPDYAQAYAGLADTYALLGSMPYAVMPPIEASTRAKVAAKRALAIDGDLVDAQVSLAFVVYSFDWDWTAGEAGFRRAIEIDPEYQQAHYWYSLFLGELGRFDEQLSEAQRALDIDPLSLVGNYAVGLAHYFARRQDQARQSLNSALEIAPNFPPARRLLGQSFLAEGKPQDAAREFDTLFNAAPDNSLSAALVAVGSGLGGDRGRATQIVDRLIQQSKTQFVPAAHIGIAAIGAGDADAAFHWLERGYDERSQALTFLKVDPIFDPIRSDPRFVPLMRKVGF